MKRMKIRMLSVCLVVALSLLTLVGCNLGDGNLQGEREEVIQIKDITFGEDVVTVIYEDGYKLSLTVKQLLEAPLVYSGMTLMMGGGFDGPDETVPREEYTANKETVEIGTPDPDGESDIEVPVESDTGVPGESFADVGGETENDAGTNAAEQERGEVRTYIASENGAKLLFLGVRVMGTTAFDSNFVYNGGTLAGNGGFANITVGTGTSSGTAISPGSNLGSMMAVTTVTNKYFEFNGKKYAAYDTDARFAEFFAARLTEVTVEGTVESFSDNGFSNVVDRILSGGFANMRLLEKVTLPDTLTRIESKAFLNCEALKDIFFAGTMEQWKAIQKSANWNEGTGEYTVHCADGDILKSEDTVPSVDDEKK